MSIECEIRDNEDNSRIAIEEYEVVPHVGWLIAYGEVITPVKQVLLRPSPNRAKAMMTDDYSVVLFV